MTKHTHTHTQRKRLDKGTEATEAGGWSPSQHDLKLQLCQRPPERAYRMSECEAGTEEVAVCRIDSTS